MLYGFGFAAFLLDMLIIPTLGGSSAAAGLGSAGQSADDEHRFSV